MDNMGGTYYSYSQLIELLQQVSEEKTKGNDTGRNI